MDLVGGSPLAPETLEQRLEAFLFAAPSQRSATRIADSLARLRRDDQEFALRWAEIAAQSYTELGYQVAILAPTLLRALGRQESEQLILLALERFDESGGAAAMDVLRDVDGFRLRRQRGEAAATLATLQSRLERLLHGLSGRRLAVEEAPGGTAWTDTETVFLPATVEGGETRLDNVARYRATVALLWGQTVFGTFNGDADSHLARWADRDRALGWFVTLESVRIEAAIARELPGLAADIRDSRPELEPFVASVSMDLQNAEATVADTIAILDRLQLEGEPPPPETGYPVGIDLDAATRVRKARIERECELLRRLLAGSKSAPVAPAASAEAETGNSALPFAIAAVGELGALPPEAAAAVRSLLQDLGELPREFTAPAGDGGWRPTERRDGASETLDATIPGALRYDEWDFRRNTFRRQWCHLTESPVGDGDPAYVPAVRQRYRQQLAQLRRRFEIIRGESRILRRQADGEEIDLDALVESRADRHAGSSASHQLYRRRLRNDRSLSALLMIDMSGSTKGWINDAEREALVLLGEAIESLGDAWAIYGFSGWTRTRCDIYRIKAFADPYDDRVQRRIAAIEAKDYTRMGVAIRHLSRELARQATRHRLLITLSDGKPDDFSDEYRSRYGIEDTRHALLEARALGIRSYCVTIDRSGADYLPHMYGPASFSVIDDVRALPLKIAEIYRRLVT